MRLLGLVGLLACGAEAPRQGSAPVAEVGAPRGAGLVLEASGPFVYGTTVDLVVTGAAADEEVFVVYGLAGAGPGPCPAVIGGSCLDLNGRAKLLTSGRSDADGTAVIPMTLPPDGPEAELSLQAAVVRGLGGADSLIAPAIRGPVTHGEEVVELLDFVPPAVDLLFLVDDSCSMAEEQSALAGDTSGLLDTIGAVTDDWHVGVVTTDMDNPAREGRLINVGGDLWTSAASPDPADDLSTRIRVGTSGSGHEQGLAALGEALGPLAATVNAGFSREHAQLTVVVLSDEDDGSPDGPTVVSRLASMKERPEDLTFNLITGLEGGCAAAAASPIYIDASITLGGSGTLICDYAYMPFLRDVIAGWAGSAPLALASPAVDGTVSVTVIAPDGVETVLADDAFELVDGGAAVRLTTARAEPGSQVQVTYVPR